MARFYLFVYQVFIGDRKAERGGDLIEGRGRGAASRAIWRTTASEGVVAETLMARSVLRCGECVLMVQVTYFAAAEMVCVRSVVAAMVAEGGWRRARPANRRWLAAASVWLQPSRSERGRPPRPLAVRTAPRPSLAKRPSAFALCAGSLGDIRVRGRRSVVYAASVNIPVC